MKKGFIAFGIAFALVIGAIACVINYGQIKSKYESACARATVERIEDAAVDYANAKLNYLDGTATSAKIAYIENDASYGGKRVSVMFYDCNDNRIGGAMLSLNSILAFADQQFQWESPQGLFLFFFIFQIVKNPTGNF